MRGTWQNKSHSAIVTTKEQPVICEVKGPTQANRFLNIYQLLRGPIYMSEKRGIYSPASHRRRMHTAHSRAQANTDN